MPGGTNYTLAKVLAKRAATDIARTTEQNKASATLGKITAETATPATTARNPTRLVPVVSSSSSALA